MLHLFGVKLHPAVGILGGSALIVCGLLYSELVLCAVGAVMVFAAVSQRVGSRPRNLQ